MQMLRPEEVIRTRTSQNSIDNISVRELPNKNWNCWLSALSETVFFAIGRDIKNAVPRTLEIADCCTCFLDADRGPAVVKLDKQLINADLG